MISLDKRLNTTSVATLTSIALAYICSYIHPALSIIALLLVIPLYFIVQRSHARYKLLDKVWHLDGAWSYVFPFAIYLVMGDLTRTLLPGFEDYHIYITYCLRTVAVGYILIRYRSMYTELASRRLDGISILIGVVIFLLWVGLEGIYPMFSSADVHYDPTIFDTAAFGFLILVRFAGSVLVAPFVEELFCRSFLMRYLIDSKWQAVPIGAYTLGSFIIVTLFFGFSHFRWLPGILTAVLLNLLLYRTKNLSSCVAAHATANLLLLVYVVCTGKWGFF
ncbi:MAG: CAAX protease self-immunity [Candidatus Argoarchaeum ethanivorans]|uniref:CAAX protease self-immunity n=1 Tax=Candidatus Argoarchaeum ethanivorans TaxID=2608793 RepID=A0A811T9Y2_9EURY|nr:MAG: CAAX protease self-immunity [Candidatus Argoarchaeum ethanivorans]